MGEFKPGEIIDITIEGARVVIDGALLSVRYPTRDGECPVQFDLQSDAITATRVAPADWPPRPGDLWRDSSGGLWFAADVHDIDKTDRLEIVMVWTYEDYRLSPNVLSRQCGPLTLVHREDQAEVSEP